MAMVACPGCGLPREAEWVGVAPCPVCADTPAVDSIAPMTPKPAAPDPVASLPADASQLDAHGPLNQPLARFAIVWAFLLGIAVGVGGILAMQRWSPDEESVQNHRPALSGSDSLNDLIGRSPALAPMPHTPRRSVSGAPAESNVERMSRQREIPNARPAPLAGAIKTIIPLNQPDAAYTIPRRVERGEHMILRGKVRMLRVNGLGPGAVLDASALEVGSIYVSGKIEGGSILRLNCPEGVVEVPATVQGRSRLEIDAPGSSVRFLHPSGPDQPGSRIGGGSTVIITGRTVDLRGDVAGAETSVRVTLTRNGSLKVAAVRDAAVVEYSSETPQASEPAATAAVVELNAIFRKLTAR